MSLRNGKHVIQKPHGKENCKINEVQHSHPDTDCGHRVESGPAIKQIGDLNIYDTDHGKRAIVAGGPKHDLDQDVEHGPGTK